MWNRWKFVLAQVALQVILSFPVASLFALYGPLTGASAANEARLVSVIVSLVIFSLIFCLTTLVLRRWIIKSDPSGFIRRVTILSLAFGLVSLVLGNGAMALLQACLVPLLARVVLKTKPRP